MAQYGGTDRARLEQERRQREFRERMRNPQQREQMLQNDSYAFEFSEWLMRRLTPFALLIYAATILFLLSWFFTSSTSLVENGSAYFHKGEVISFEAPTGGAIYHFDLKQDFSAGKSPLYSELEIEIIDANLDHIYTVYKDLWLESHPNGEGGIGVYKDLAIRFDVELPEAGIYYLRGISHNNNEALISGNIFKKTAGSLYFGFYALIFGILSLILMLGFQKWGSPVMMIEVWPKLMSWKENTGFLRATTLVIFLFIGTWIISITHYGYAAGGDEIVLPTYFYKTNTVIYLG